MDEFIIGEREGFIKVADSLRATDVVSGQLSFPEDFIYAINKLAGNDGPETGEYVAEIGDRKFYTVQHALSGAAPGETVKLLTNSIEAVNLVIPEGATLDLQGYTLTVDSIVGLDGSFLTATVPHATNPYVIANANAKLIAPKGSIMLSEQGYQNEIGQYILPIWDNNNSCYLFSLFAVNTANEDRGLWLNESSETLRFVFKHQATSAINQGLLIDGADDNELSIIVRLEWESGNGVAYQEFVYNNAQVGLATGAHDYSFTLKKYSQLHINLDTLKVYGMVKTNSGATAFGDIWTLENAKRDETIVPVAQIGEQTFYTVEKALATAVSGDTITLIADTIENTTITIPSGVTLDLRGYTLKANRVTGLSGSFLNATCPTSNGTGGGKLIIPKGNLTLSEKSFVDSNNYNILPVWTGSEYIFSRLVTNNDKVIGDKLKVTDDSIFFQFGYNATSYVKNTYFADGFSDNALSMIVRISWNTFDSNGNFQGIAIQDFVYSDIQVGNATNNASLVYELTNYKDLGIDLEKGDVTISGMIVADSGVVANNVQMNVYYTEDRIPVAQIGEQTFYTIEKALAAAISGDTIMLTADSIENTNLVIPEGVTLDLQEYTLTADSVVGLNGSFMTATPNTGKLIVPQGNITLSEQGWKNTSGQYVLPVWDSTNEYYLFSLFVVNTNLSDNPEYGLTIDYANDRIEFSFKHQATGAINQGLFKDGADDNELAMIIHLEWEKSGQGIVTYDLKYNNEQVGLVTSKNRYTFAMNNYSKFGIDVNTLKVQARIVTKSGATAFGDIWTLENAKQDDTIVPVAQIGEQQFYTVEKALAAAAPGDTVMLTADTIENTTITIPSGVTLDLREYTLTADRVVGLNGSFMTANCPASDGTGAGKLVVVAKENLTLSKESYIDSAEYNILPVWTGNEYIFSRLFTHQNNMTSAPLEVTEDSITFRFRFNATSYVKSTYLTDGCSDNALQVIMRIIWDNYDAAGNYIGKASQDFAFSDAQVGGVAGGSAAFKFTLTNYNDLGINLENGNVKISGMIITDSGAIAQNVNMDVVMP